MIHLALTAVALYVLVCAGVLLLPYAIGAAMMALPVLGLWGTWLALRGPLGDRGAGYAVIAVWLGVLFLADYLQHRHRRRALSLR
jgi:hypothetical protein